MKARLLLALAPVGALAGAHLALAHQALAHQALGRLALPLLAGLAVAALALHLGVLGFIGRRLHRR